MRLNLARTLLGAAVVTLGLTLMLPVFAAERSDDEYKGLLAQDVKALTKATDALAKTPGDKKIEKNASGGIKSTALIVATYSNSQITGKDAAADAKAAGVRDEAIKLFKAGNDKDWKTATEIVKGLSSAKPAAKGEKIDVIKALGTEVTSKEVMDNLSKPNQHYGTNAEADIIANSRKAKATIADTNLIVHRVLVMGELSKTITKTTNAAEKKEWEEYNEKMVKAAEDLLAVSKKPKVTPVELAKAYTTLDGSCKRCHDVFKKE
jgi:hypothetical protein